MNIKRELIFGIGGVIVITVLTIFIVKEYNRISMNPSNKNINTSNVSNLNQSSSANTVVLSQDEVAKHNSASDCWQIINSSVYNVTDYLNQHPAGAQIMIPYCGKDATEAYNTKGGRGPHSPRANQDLVSLKIGDLNQAVSAQQTNSTNTVNSSTPLRKREFEDDDD